MLPIGKSLYSRAVLIDTGAFIAIINPRDRNHEMAKECLHDLVNYRLPVFVSIPTILESHRRYLFDFGYDAANQFLQSVYDGSLNIIRNIADDETEARKILAMHADLALTLTDAMNMSVMTRLGIARSFSFDRHYLQAGFIRVPPLYL